jgi:branched-chain amino acid transport system substrate-binding protein
MRSTSGSPLRLRRSLLVSLLAMMTVAGGCGSGGSQKTAEVASRTAPAATEAAHDGGVAAAGEPAVAAPGPAGDAAAPSPKVAPSGAGHAAAGAARLPSEAGSATKPTAGKAPAPGGPVSAAAAAPTPVPAPGPGVTPAPSPAEAKSEILLGSIGTEGGVLGSLMLPILQGGRAWVADVNARGGLNGHPVRVIFGDDGGDPSRALGLARRMVDQNVVAFYLDHGPGTFQAIAPFLEEKKIPMIGGCNCSIPTARSPMFFPIGPAAEVGLAWSQVLPLFAYSDERKVSILYCRETAGCKAARDVIVGFAEKYGLKVVHNAQASVAQPDFTAEILAARNAGAEAFIALLDSFSIIRLARAAHRQNWSPTITGQYSVHDERFTKEGGKDIEGVVVGAGLLHWDSPKMADYRQAVERYVPGAIKGTFGEVGWVTGKLLEVIAKGFPAKPTKDDFLQGLHGLDGETLGGLIPPLTYREGKGHDDSNNCIIPLRIEGGKFAPKDGDNFLCAPGWQPVRK